jgi:hypothetical protein
MKTTKRLALIFTFILSPFLLFSQEKIQSNTKSQTKEGDKPFKFELLPEEKNADASFQENYDQGKTYYNKGLSIIQTSNTNISLDELGTLQKKSTEQVKLALPYLEKAHKINSNNKNVLTGLMGISLVLDDMKKYNNYKHQFDLLNNHK